MLNAVQFWHGSSHVFEVGDEVLPQAVTGRRNYLQALPERAASVFLAESHKNARTWGEHAYEVAPLGPVVPDEFATDEGDTRTTRARVLSTPKSRAQAARSLP